MVKVRLMGDPDEVEALATVLRGGWLPWELVSESDDCRNRKPVNGQVRRYLELQQPTPLDGRPDGMEMERRRDRDDDEDWQRERCR